MTIKKGKYRQCKIIRTVENSDIYFFHKWANRKGHIHGLLESSDGILSLHSFTEIKFIDTSLY